MHIVEYHNVFTARFFDYFDSGVMEGLQHRLQELAASRTQGRLAETPGNSMALTSQVSCECNHCNAQLNLSIKIRFKKNFSSRF